MACLIETHCSCVLRLKSNCREGMQVNGKSSEGRKSLSVCLLENSPCKVH